MDGLSRLMQIVYMDARHKGAVTKTMTAEDIDQIYVMKNQLSSNASILPINDNARAQEDPRMTVATMFRANERHMITGQPHETPVLDMSAHTPQRIKTNVFSSAVNKMLHWSPLDRFSTAAKTKAEPLNKAIIRTIRQDIEPAAKTMAIDVVSADGKVVPFKLRNSKLTIAS